jgi:hypothetical protein
MRHAGTSPVAPVVQPAGDDVHAPPLNGAEFLISDANLAKGRSCLRAPWLSVAAMPDGLLPKPLTNVLQAPRGWSRGPCDDLRSARSRDCSPADARTVYRQPRFRDAARMLRRRRSSPEADDPKAVAALKKHAAWSEINWMTRRTPPLAGQWPQLRHRTGMRHPPVAWSSRRGNGLLWVPHGTCVC